MRRTDLLSRIDDDRGWTLIELMVVVLIIGILLAMALAVYSVATGSASAAACTENQSIMNRAISVARASGGEIDEISDLVDSVRNFDTASVCPLDGTPLVYDPDSDSVTCPNHP